MKIVQLITEIKEFDAISELNSSDRKLFKAALDATNLSYSPYSKFKVGAALLLENGEIIIGSNQENASYSLCLCAEQVALHRAANQYPGIKIKTIAVTALNNNEAISKPAPPCGACRQVLSEYEHRQTENIRIILGNSTGKCIVLESANDLLPLHFDPSFLKL